MARMRQLMLGVASSSALYSGLVPALGLGEITLHSALNQPFEAEIELLQVGDLGAGEMKVRLAPVDVFERSGVERFYFLNDLRFTPVLQGSRNVIRVVSNKPVREPYLNFIVEVSRPNGQLLREYTVLLDPPGSSAYTPVATALPPAQQPARRTEAVAPVAASAAAAPAVEPPSARLGHRHQVQRGDSLWVIANRLREEGSVLSLQALMDGIHALNPTAFSGGDRSRLMAGVELLLPDAARTEPAPVSSEMAAAEPTDPPAAAQAPQPTGVAQAVPGPAAQTDELQQLAQRQQQLDEELLTQAAEKLELQQGLAQLQLQVQQLQEQLAQRDARLVELTEQVSSAAPAAQAEPAAAAPAAQAQPVAEQTNRDSWLLGAMALLLLLLLGILLWASRRRRKAQARPVEVDPSAPRAAAAAVALRPVATPAPAVAPARVAAVAAPAVSVAARSVAPSDPLEAANVYIAYGRFSEARGELSKALAQAPERGELRMRLLEVLAELGDATAFAREEAILREQGFDAHRLEQLHARYPVLHAAPAAQVSMPTHQEVRPAAGEALVDSDFQLNLDDLSLDADWDLVSPFQSAASSRSREKAPAATPVEEHFSSNLQELPEVFELDLEHEAHQAFARRDGEMPVEDEALDEHFLDAFSGEADATAALQGDIDQLAGNPAHMAKLNQALAYIEQGNIAAACDILNEVIDQGDDEQKQAARQLLAEIA